MTRMFNNLIFGLAIISVLGLAYIAFIQNNDGELLSGIASSGQAALETQEFLARLQDLKKIEIDDSLFSDPRFTSLRDFRQAIVDEPTGRTNPFRPVE